MTVRPNKKGKSSWFIFDILISSCCLPNIISTFPIHGGLWAPPLNERFDLLEEVHTMFMKNEWVIGVVIWMVGSLKQSMKNHYSREALLLWFQLDLKSTKKVMNEIRFVIGRVWPWFTIVHLQLNCKTIPLCIKKENWKKMASL